MNKPILAEKDDIYDLKARLENTEIAIGLILAELSKQVDAIKAVDDALRTAETEIYPGQITQILEKIKSAMSTSLNQI
jgi:hypothetical protein